MKKWLFILFLIGFWGQLQAQDNKTEQKTALEKLQADTLPKPSILDKKFYWGFAFVNAWTSISNSSDYFYKPSLGGGLRMDYYFTKSLGLSAGFNFQQRGTGILTPDTEKSLGNADSTYRLRVRFNCLDFPLAVVYRSPKGIFGGKGVRLFLSAGTTPQFNFQSNRVFISAEDGFHDVQDQSKDYYVFDTTLDASAGFLISAGNSSTFLVDFLAQFGGLNAYRNSDLSGKNRLFGIRMAWLF